MQATLLFSAYALMFCVGVMFVVWGSNGIVDGATLVNKLTKVPMFFLGMFMVSIATTSPEFTVNIFAAIEGKVQMAIGNIVGSNIFNIAGILGVCSIIRGIKTDRDIVVKQVPLATASIFILGALCFDGELTRLDGLILLGFFAVYLVYLYFSARHATKLAKEADQTEHHEEGEEIQPAFLSIFWDILFKVIDWFRSLVGKEKHASRKVHEVTGDTIPPVAKVIIYLVVGFGILIYGSRLMVTYASSMASMIGITESFISLTIVAIGTSMPEFAVSVMSIVRKKKDLAIGNIVGANTMNALWALGIDTLFIRNLPFATSNMIDILMALAVAFFLWLFMYIGKRNELERWQGIIFVIGYIVYVIYILYR
jgi:cation:H+ antiporter